MRKLLFSSLLLLWYCITNAQMLIDKQIQMTGGVTADRRITNLADPANAGDATNATSIQTGQLVYADATGSGGDYVISLMPAPTAYTKGMIVNFRANHPNTGVARVTVNTLAQVTIKKAVTTDLAGGDILTGQMVSLIFDGTNFQLLSGSGSTSGSCGSANYVVKSNGVTATCGSIFDNGLVGIGTNNPSALLTVGTENNPFRVGTSGDITVTGGSDNQFSMYDGGGNAKITNLANGNMWLQSDKVTIDAGGQLGIGTTAPVRKLHLLSSGSVEMIMEQSNALANYRRWNWVVSDGTGSAASNFYLRQLNDNGTGGAVRLYFNGTNNYMGVGLGSASSTLTVAGDGTGSANIGSGFCGGNYTGIALNGLIGCANYNIMSSTNDQNLFINRPGGSSILFREGNGDQVAITTGGKLGIGTTNPSKALQVEKEMLISGNGSGGGEYNDWPVSSLSIRRSDDYVLNGVTMMTLGYRNDDTYQTGNGVAAFRLFDPGQAANCATSSGTTQLHISAPGTLALQDVGGNVGIGTGNTAAVYQLQLSQNSAAKPGSTAWINISDIRLKENIQDYTDGVKSIMDIHPITYNYNKLSGYNTEETYVGVVAQDLQKVAPYMVSTFKKDGEEYLAVDNGALTYMLVNAVKEQQTTIEKMQREIDQLKSRVITGSIGK